MKTNKTIHQAALENAREAVDAVYESAQAYARKAIDAVYISEEEKEKERIKALKWMIAKMAAGTASETIDEGTWEGAEIVEE